MNDIVVQGLMWVAAGGCLLLYMKRRRNRKISSLGPSLLWLKWMSFSGSSSHLKIPTAVGRFSKVVRGRSLQRSHCWRSVSMIVPLVHAMPLCLGSSGARMPMAAGGQTTPYPPVPGSPAWRSSRFRNAGERRVIGVPRTFTRKTGGSRWFPGTAGWVTPTATSYPRAITARQSTVSPPPSNNAVVSFFPGAAATAAGTMAARVSGAKMLFPILRLLAWHCLPWPAPHQNSL